MKPIIFLILIQILISCLIPEVNGFVPENNTEIAISSDDVLRQEIRQILNNPRFHYPDFVWLKRIIKKIAAYFTNTQIRHAPKLSAKLQNHLQMIYFCLALALPIILLLIFRRFWHPENRLKIKAAAHTGDSQHPHYLLTLANQYAESGDFREAIRYLYLESLSYLRKLRLLPDGPGFSGRDHLRFLRKQGSSQGLYHSYQDLLFIFEEKWYGMKPCRPEEYRKAYQLLQAIRSCQGGPHDQI